MNRWIVILMLGVLPAWAMEKEGLLLSARGKCAISEIPIECFDWQQEQIAKDLYESWDPDDLVKLEALLKAKTNKEYHARADVYVYPVTQCVAVEDLYLDGWPQKIRAEFSLDNFAKLLVWARTKHVQPAEDSFNPRARTTPRGYQEDAAFNPRGRTPRGYGTIQDSHEHL